MNDECRDPSERDRLSSVGNLTHFGFVVSQSYSPEKCDLKWKQKNGKCIYIFTKAHGKIVAGKIVFMF